MWFSFSNQHFCPRACLPSLSCLLREGKVNLHIALVALRGPSWLSSGPSTFLQGCGLASTCEVLDQILPSTEAEELVTREPVTGTAWHSHPCGPRPCEPRQAPLPFQCPLPSLWDKWGHILHRHLVGSGPLTTPACQGSPCAPISTQGCLGSPAPPFSSSTQ